MDNNQHTNIKNAATILLFSIANADNNIEKLNKIQKDKEEEILL